MERYTSLYRLPKNQYTAGSPVLLAAGTLLKDSQTGAVLAQLKMQSLSAKPIRAVMVAVDASDVSGAPLEGVSEYQYLDLTVRRDDTFGQHQAIVLPDANTRCIAVRCTRVVFADGTSWEAEPTAVWSSLPEPETLEKALSMELVRQYCRDTAACAAFQCAKFGDLWRCTCGALNASGQTACHACGLTLDAQLAALNKTALREHLAAYEKAEAEKQEARQAKNQKIRKKALKIGLPAAAVCVAAVILVTTVIVPGQKYRNALSLLDAGDYTAGYAILEDLGKSEEITQNKYDRAMVLIDAEKYDSAYELLEEIGDTEAIQSNKYDRAMKEINAGDYDSAYALLEELGKTEEVVANKYDRAMEEINAEDYDSAYALLEEIGNDEAIAASKYDRAMERIDAQDYETAFALLEKLNYKDSEEKRGSVKLRYYRELLMNANAGDTVFFGSYEQDNNTSNGKEDIEWLVLAKEDDRLLVISQYALDCKPYNRERADVTWENCTLRKWLNGTFFSTVFSNKEKAMIPTVAVSADKNPYYNTNPGNATEDKVFLLSIAEVNKYFKNDEARMCAPTDYAKANGAYTSNTYIKDGAAACWWWLRSPCGKQSIAAEVVSSGFVHNGGDYVDNDGPCVRPAMWISLED